MGALAPIIIFPARGQEKWVRSRGGESCLGPTTSDL